MFMPRAAIAWQPNEGVVIRGGYGMYYDSLNASHVVPNQLGYSHVTSVAVSDDFGQTWNIGDPASGVPPVVNPFPAGFESVPGDSLGADIVAGTSYDYHNLDRESARMQRWRVGVQHALGRNMSVEIAYVGSYADRVDVTVRQDVLPERYWNHTQVRDDARATDLTSHVTNPFHIDNFGALKASDPRLYSHLVSLPFFSSPTIEKHNLLRAFPHINGLQALSIPLGKVRTHGIEISFQRRFSGGLSAHASYVGMRAEEWTTILNEYEQAPTAWLTSQNARPHRVTASGVYELPFGRERAFLQRGLLSSILGSWQLGATFEYQPGPLLEWPHLFFYGNVDDIHTGTSRLDRWFNVDPGFERTPAKAPAEFQARTFPLRIDGLRRDRTMLLNLSVQRTFGLTGRARLQLRLDAANLLNRDHFNAPEMDPTSTLFGRVTSSSSTANRFLTFLAKVQF